MADERMQSLFTWLNDSLRASQSVATLYRMVQIIIWETNDPSVRLLHVYPH